MFWALWELKLLEPDLAVLGIPARPTLDRTRKKQLAVLSAALEAVGIPLGRDRNVPAMAMNAVIELAFPDEQAARGSRLDRLQAAWSAIWRRPEPISTSELDVHHNHAIRTARGVISRGGRPGA